jgi:CMP-N,N'-diacetyllegionaminic acid synthase
MFTWTRRTSSVYEIVRRVRPEVSRNILCVIAARGGSQGVPGKNVRCMLGKPLVARAVETVLATPHIEEVFVSTDSTAIADAACAAGATVAFMRPAELAQATSGKFQVWQHALQTCAGARADRDYQVYVDLDCTNPLIEPADVSAAIELFYSRRGQGIALDAVMTVAPARRNPYFNLVEPDATGALKMSKTAGPRVLARQSAPVVYEHVAGVYVLDTQYLRRASHLLDGRVEGYTVGEDKAFDVDSELDFILIEYLLGRRAAR